MTTAVHLCAAQDLAQLVGLAERRWQEAGTPAEAEHLTQSLAPLTDNSGLGAAYLFGPRRAPLGYMALTFGWCLDLAALEAHIEDLYIRPSVRQRGLARDLVHLVGKSLASGGIARLSLRPPDPGLVPFAQALGFRPDPAQRLLREL